MILSSEHNRATDTGARWALLPVALGVALIASNRFFGTVDDECAIIDQAARPISETLRLFWQGLGVHEHPPLYDILLHGWLMLTKGNLYLLRLPSIFFYVLGAWILSRAARHLGGTRSQYSALILVALWPFGFHFGRLATWYSFCFLSVSLLTIAYLKFLEQPGLSNWFLLLAASLILIYSNYFGWVFLGCLAFDYMFRYRHNWKQRYGHLLGLGACLLLAYLPLFRVLQRELHANTHPYFRLSTLANIAYDVYCLFASESVAPWLWFFGIPVSLAIIACLALALWRAPAAARFFLICALLQIALMTFLSIGISKRMLLVSPWILLPVAVALGTLPNTLARRLMILSLSVVAAIGWFGIFSRRFYAAPHWVEPWQAVARQASTIVGPQGAVIGNNPSFFFYLTYLLPTTPVAFENARFPGLLPDSVHNPSVYTPKQWIDSNEPTAARVLLVRGTHYGTGEESTEEAQSWLDSHCALLESKRLVHDTGWQLKQSYTGILQPEWRVETRMYDCRSNLGGTIIPQQTHIAARPTATTKSTGAF